MLLRRPWLRAAAERRPCLAQECLSPGTPFRRRCFPPTLLFPVCGEKVPAPAHCRPSVSSLYLDVCRALCVSGGFWRRWPEQLRGNASDPPSWCKSLQVHAQVISGSGDDIAFAGGEALQSHARHLLGGFAISSSGR